MTNGEKETMVRMGELAISRDPGHLLASIGLGSCIGLVLIDSTRAIAGLAHIMLPRRNEQATREALEAAGVQVRASATGGSKGRTVRVQVETGLVTVKEPGSPEVELFKPVGMLSRAR